MAEFEIAKAFVTIYSEAQSQVQEQAQATRVAQPAGPLVPGQETQPERNVELLQTRVGELNTAIGEMLSLAPRAAASVADVAQGERVVAEASQHLGAVEAAETPASVPQQTALERLRRVEPAVLPQRQEPTVPAPRETALTNKTFNINMVVPIRSLGELGRVIEAVEAMGRG